MAEAPVVAIVQARMGSSRLPGKVLRSAAGRTLLAHVIERLRRARTLTDTWIATSDRPDDDAIEAEAARLGVPVFRGSEDDVLDRFRGAAEASAAAVVVRITADCPVMDPAEVDCVVSAFLEASPPLDYASNLAPDDRRIPLGLSVEVCARAALERAWREGKDRYHREHVTPYLYEAPGRFRTRVVHPDRDLHDLRLTVDTPEDLEVVTAVLEAVEGVPDGFSLAAALRFLDAHPEIRARNAGIHQRGYREASAPRPNSGATEMPALVLRADAGAEVGLGHVMRSLSLAEAWRLAGGEVALVAAALPARVAGWFEALGAAVIALPPGAAPGSAEDARFTRDAGAARGARVLCVDGYRFGPEYLRTLRAPGQLLATLDDHAQPDLPADVVIRPNAGAPAGDAGGPLVLAGAQYILLREEIRQAAVALDERTLEGGGKHLLLAFGGSDPARLSARALDAALAVGAPLFRRVTVLAGPLHPDVDALRAAAAGAPIPVAVRSVDPAVAAAGRAPAGGLGDLLAGIDLALAAAGGTAWELAAVGVPMLLVEVADNQRAVLGPLVAAGAARALGRADALTGEQIQAGLRDLAAAGPAAHGAMARAGRALVDGGGARRIAAALASRAREAERATARAGE